MQQADHSFAVLHTHSYLCWVSTSASWLCTDAQGRALVPATRVDTVDPCQVQFSPQQQSNPYFPNEGQV